MDIIPFLLREINEESEITRKMLSIVPDGQFSWKPHAKSMSIRELASHIADIPSWVDLAVNTEELDFAKTGYDSHAKADNREQLLAIFEASLAKGVEALKGTNETVLHESWTMRDGDTVFFTCTKYEMVRNSLAQTIHHRAQLGVFLRLLDIPIPGTYGPSADEAM